MADLEVRMRPRTRSRTRWSVETTVGATIVAVVVVVAVVGPLLSPWDPNVPDVLSALEPPSLEHWMGTDSVGRDVLTRTFVGTQISLLAGVVITLATLTIGTIIGSLVAYAGGWVDAFVSRVIDTAIAIPFLVVVLAMVAILGVGTFSVGVGIVVVGWAVYA
ncbi:MAG: ABC transporter permease, partial [Microbacterium sp.]